MTMRTSASHCVVNRQLYSEETFAEDYEKVYWKRKTTLDHIKQYFSCDSKRAKNAALSLLPIIGWMKMYRVKEWLLGDIVSGVSTGLVAILQGAFPVLSLMVGAVVTRLVPDEGSPVNITGLEGLTMNEQRAIVSASLTCLVGIFQLAMGVLQVGFIAIYLSDTLVSGFTTAAAVHILISQLKFVLGLTVPGFSGPLAIIYILEGIFSQITSTNLYDLVTSIVVMVVVFIVKELNDRFRSKLPVPIPIEVIMTVIACGVSYAFNFKENHGVDVVGKIPDGFEAPVAPNLHIFQETAVDAFPIAIVGFAVAFSVAKVYSVKYDYVIDGNQIAGALSAIIVLTVTLAIGFLLEPLLKVEAHYIAVVCDVFAVSAGRSGNSESEGDADADLGLAVGLGVELLAVVFRTQLPRCSVLANITGTDIYRDRKDYINIYEPEGVKIFKIPAPIFFANIDFFRRKLVDAVGLNPLRILRKRNKALRKMKKLIKKGELTVTSKGLKVMVSFPIDKSEDESIMEDLDQPVDFSDLPVQALKVFIRVDVEIYIVACDPYIIEKLKSCKFIDDEIKTSIFFLTLHNAILHILQLHPTLTISEKAYSSIHDMLYNGNSSLRSREKPIKEPETRF
ncbi:hypothetical protein MHYP_G00317900 [Metynnis hypsauchen]